jgi:hypothetical protein
MKHETYAVKYAGDPFVEAWQIDRSRELSPTVVSLIFIASYLFYHQTFNDLLSS